MKLKGAYLFLSAVLITSCSDVFIEDFIVDSWEMKTYLRNEADETSAINISNYEETYVLDGTFSRRYIDGKQHLIEETGKFEINEDNLTIHISDVSSISDFSDQHSTLSASTIKVETIDESEFVYTFENGGDKHEFRFLKKD